MVQEGRSPRERRDKAVPQAANPDSENKTPKSKRAGLGKSLRDIKRNAAKGKQQNKKVAPKAAVKKVAVKKAPVKKAPVKKVAKVKKEKVVPQKKVLEEKKEAVRVQKKNKKRKKKLCVLLPSLNRRNQKRNQEKI